MKLSKASVNLPFGLGSAEWEPSTEEKHAAWSLYVELVTRVAIEPLEPNSGSIREAMSSLHSLFAITREILKDAGTSAGLLDSSVGGIAIHVLNTGIRPFLTKWHPRLSEWEAAKPAEVSAIVHEEHWSFANDCLRDLESVRKEIETYTNSLKVISSAQTPL